ncbi:EscU/YscU/HrcU family type III secretion system export apparatus switch protein [Caldalkalibacillus salinus]|uniref:EscU/YscU/HrcU family type III secretion system export apparatus switch protein n=1 Tax=Caldalkalibacillus salinus TaxID=2803787 RepID=UPI0019204E0E|nr:EscU/YscU/HrcU family type III secretion system export apparatus switch protein [Caldalkalibacillus salinus]
MSRHTPNAKKAIALRYDQHTDDAPVVKAKGQESLAERMIQLAQENDVPIHEDPALVEVLSKLEIDDVIPPELYQIMAEIFALIYQLESQAKQDSHIGQDRSQSTDE